ncbi:hypothetical protein PR048_017769 [Dryococelus australis]|uniref:Uncharacterized protein n=1 Tax=Dryococelus australis TaxID=614101 RepID=A0ABQ9HAI1_9NEOP|nr:hypothetical protein PR048_017769 [Dryococelus australis]
MCGKNASEIPYSDPVDFGNMDTASKTLLPVTMQDDVPLPLAEILKRLKLACVVPENRQQAAARGEDRIRDTVNAIVRSGRENVERPPVMRSNHSPRLSQHRRAAFLPTRLKPVHAETHPSRVSRTSACSRRPWLYSCVGDHVRPAAPRSLTTRPRSTLAQGGLNPSPRPPGDNKQLPVSAAAVPGRRRWRREGRVLTAEGGEEMRAISSRPSMFLSLHRHTLARAHSHSGDLCLHADAAETFSLDNLTSLLTKIIKNRHSAGLFSGLALKIGECLKKIDDRKNIDYIFWDDPNKLADTLRLLLTSLSVGNYSHTNEIVSMIEEFKEATHIR